MKYSPLKQTERIELIDALRGFALLGILMKYAEPTASKKVL